MKPVLYVSLGGIVGTLARYALALILPQDMYGTLSANLIGVALVMFFMVLMQRRGITELRYFLLPGFCGGLTTFSAVTLQVVEPGEGGFIYLLVTVVASLAIAAISLNLSRKYIKVQA